MRTYDMPTVVTFEETNVVGNVYYTQHLRWQGRCRELFLRDHAPSIIDELQRGLVLATSRCSCEYFAELFPFDDVIVRMHLVDLAQNRVTMGFEYFRTKDGTEELIATGEQQIVTMRRVNQSTEPTPVPEALRRALEPFARG